MEHHRNQTVNFRQHAFPLSGAAVPFLLKARFQSLNVGDLFEYVATKLWELTAVRTNPNDFTLVNVCSPFAKYSHGSCPPPPEMARPKGLMAIFTFATTMLQEYPVDLELRPQDVRRHSIHSTQWGTDMELQFVSISVSTTQAHELGLVNLQANQCQYLYNTMGPLTKSLLMKQVRYEPGDDDYEDLHSRYNLVALHNKLATMPIPRLFQDIPYPLWVFSKTLWEKAPNLIPQRCITPSAALYFFMFLSDTISVNNNVMGDIKAKRLGLNMDSHDGVMGHLSDSVINFLQMVKTPGDSQLEVRELLAPAVLQSYVVLGKPTVFKGTSYMRVMSEEARNFAASLQDVTDLGQILLPADRTAYNVMHEDRDFANTLLNKINLEPL